MRLRPLFARTLLFAGLAAGAFAAPAGAQQLQEALMTYCKGDIERLCKGVPPGDGRLLACLQSHPQQITVGCAKVLQQLKQKM